MTRRMMTMVVLIIALSLGGGGAAAASAPQDRSAEDGVRAALDSFQRGVEAGDKDLGPRLAAGSFSAHFVPFYNMLADVYSRNRLAFPVKIGHVKILQDGRAKAETRINPGEDLFVFTLIMEGGSWKFSHMEGILLPVFEAPSVPASSVCAISPDKVKWMMCEKEVAFRASVFEALRQAAGPSAARAFFVNQAAGFRVAMDAWLPFLEGAAQFAVFYGIIEENYYGSKYILTKAGMDEAEIRFSPLQELEVMKIAVFWPKMSLEEHQSLYRDIMTERARVCGLDVEVDFEGTSCTLRLKRSKAQPIK